MVPLPGPLFGPGYFSNLAAAANGVIAGDLELGPEKAPPFPRRAQQPAPRGEWITLEFIVNEKRLIVKVNGEVTTDVEDETNLKAGRVALSLSGQAKCEFRKIEIKELKPDAAPPVGATPGFTPLFNGKDLDGWKTASKVPGKWSVEGGILAGTGPPASSIMSPRADYKDFHLRADARISDGGAAALFFRAAYDPLEKPDSGSRFVQRVLFVHQDSHQSRGLA